MTTLFAPCAHCGQPVGKPDTFTTKQKPSHRRKLRNPLRTKTHQGRNLFNRKTILPKNLNRFPGQTSHPHFSFFSLPSCLLVFTYQRVVGRGIKAHFNRERSLDRKSVV